MFQQSGAVLLSSQPAYWQAASSSLENQCEKSCKGVLWSAVRMNVCSVKFHKHCAPANPRRAIIQCLPASSVLICTAYRYFSGLALASVMLPGPTAVRIMYVHACYTSACVQHSTNCTSCMHIAFTTLDCVEATYRGHNQPWEAAVLSQHCLACLFGTRVSFAYA
jgi:hypothetical protein